MLFTLLAGVAQAQNMSTLPNNYTLSINVESDRDSFTNFTVSLLKFSKATAIPHNEVSRYSLISFNRPKDILWASCAEGYRLTKATSKTDARVFRMDASDPTSNAGIEFSERRNYSTYKLTIICSAKASVSQLTFAQTSRSSNAAANKKWKKVYMAFSAAVNKRDRAALKRMLSSPFDSGGGGDYSPNKWIKFIDDENLWSQLLKSVASGTKPFSYKRRPSRITNDRYLIFEYGADGRWRWVTVMGD
jgi:hypothetical protein